MEIRELVAGCEDHLVALLAAVRPGSPTAHVNRLDEPEAFPRDSHLRGDRKPLGDVNYWSDLA